MNDQFTVNQRQIAFLLDVDARTIRAWQDAADDPLPCTRGKRGTANTYDPRLVVRWYINRRIGDLTNSENAGDPQQMRARLDKLRGDQVEHDLAIKRGEYAPIRGAEICSRRHGRANQIHFRWPTETNQKQYAIAASARNEDSGARARQGWKRHR